MTTDAAGKQVFVPCPQGTGVTLSTVGLHYNRMESQPSAYTLSHSVSARYWDDPHNFRPARFLGNWPKDAFIPFSAGLFVCDSSQVPDGKQTLQGRGHA